MCMSAKHRSNCCCDIRLSADCASMQHVKVHVSPMRRRTEAWICGSSSTSKIRGCSISEPVMGQRVTSRDRYREPRERRGALTATLSLPWCRCSLNCEYQVYHYGDSRFFEPPRGPSRTHVWFHRIALL